MRIANNIIFIAVVSLAACIRGWQRETRSMNSNESFSGSLEEEFVEGWLNRRDRETLLRNEMAETGQPVDCCPVVLEMIRPMGGINQNGVYVALYNDSNTVQQFYELSCRKDVADKPCRFMDRKLHNQSKCVQTYSYSYAIIKSHVRHEHHNNTPAAGSNWTLGYIRVRSGCACVLTPRTKRKRASHHKARKGRRRESEED